MVTVGFQLNFFQLSISKFLHLYTANQQLQSTKDICFF